MKVIIVGAGIAGFSAAIACRRAGHEVEIYERSSGNKELGAAIHVCPNASRGLLAWGFDPIRAKFVNSRVGWRAYASTLEKFAETDETYIGPKYGGPWWFAHRVDLHDELKRLATRPEGEGKPATVHLKSEVVTYDPEAGSITFADGSKQSGDLVIAADGVHTKAVEAILGHPNPALPTINYNFAFRFLIPTKEIALDPETAHFTENDDGRLKIINGDRKRLVWYPCRNNEENNFVCIFQNEETVSHEDWQTSVDKSVLLERYKEFHPSILAVFKKAKDIKQWPLLFRAPIPTWHKGKLVLIGDAAHPMLPHQGQGGAQAIEDSAALGIALSGAISENLEDRLRVFEKIRINRTSVMQIFSNAGQDEPEKIRKDASKYMPADQVPSKTIQRMQGEEELTAVESPQEFFQYNFGYDVIRDSKQHMTALDPNWELPAKFFEKEPRSGVYPAEIPVKTTSEGPVELPSGISKGIEVRLEQIAIEA